MMKIGGIDKVIDLKQIAEYTQGDCSWERRYYFRKFFCSKKEYKAKELFFYSNYFSKER